MKRITAILLAGMLVVACTACQPTVSVDQNAVAEIIPEIYALEGGALIDRNGNPVDASQNFQIIYSIDTNLPQAKTLSRMEDTGERDEYGNPKIRHLTALYDMDGNLLCDWEEVSYERGFDDYIVRREVRRMDMMEEIQPGFSRGLWSLTGKKLVLPEAVEIAVYDDTSYLISDNMNRFLGRIDRDLNPIGAFPLQETYYNPSVWGTYIYVVQENPLEWYDSGKSKPKNTEYLLTNDYQIVLEKDRIWASFYQACSEKLVMYEENGIQGLYSMPENRAVLQFERDEGVNYYDDEMMMLRHEKNNPSDPNNRFAFWLETIDGERLTADYQTLECIQEEYGLSENHKSASGFIGVRDNQIDLLDRSGKITTQIKLSGVVSAVSYGEIGFTYTAVMKDKNGKTLVDEWGTSTTRDGLLDKNLRVVIPAEKYQYIHPQFSWFNGEVKTTSLISGSYMMPGNRAMRSDLLDTSGKVIAKQLTMVGMVGEDRVQVIQGFQQGLIDFAGEWVYKQSLFTALEDE